MADEGQVVRSINGFWFDIDRGVLERDGQPVPIRPKSFAMLSYFARNPGRVIGKEELIEAVWGRVVITDDALTQTIKDVRRTIHDQEALCLRSVPKRGYLFVADGVGTTTVPTTETPAHLESRHTFDVLVQESLSSRPLIVERAGRWTGESEAAPSPTQGLRVSGRDRPAIAVLPFAVAALSSKQMLHLRNGLARDIVRDLARLRGLLVIAANSAEALERCALDNIDAGKLLRCDYVCAGSIAQENDILRFDVELIALDGARVLFSETFSRPSTSASRIGAELASEIVRQISGEVDLFERNLATLRHPQELDAWQAYYRGLWHMHRFTDTDNMRAARFFQLSIEKDPTFSRPYAGLSFTHWLKAYLLHPAEHNPEGALAYDLAARAVSVDPHDPAAHCAFGRALWIGGATDEALEALDHATKLSPNYAFGHYVRGFVEALSGDATVGISACDHARELSPFDPFLAPMLASRAIGLLRLGQIEEAAAWGARATRQPNAHAHVLRIAAMSLTAAGRHEEAVPLVRRINLESPGNGGDRFIKSNRFNHQDEQFLRDLARQSGLV